MGKCKACQCAEELKGHEFGGTKDGEIAKGISLVMAAHIEGWHCTCEDPLTCDLKDGEFTNGRRE